MSESPTHTAQDLLAHINARLAAGTGPVVLVCTYPPHDPHGRRIWATDEHGHTYDLADEDTYLALLEALPPRVEFQMRTPPDDAPATLTFGYCLPELPELRQQGRRLDARSQRSWTADPDPRGL